MARFEAEQASFNIAGRRLYLKPGTLANFSLGEIERIAIDLASDFAVKLHNVNNLAFDFAGRAPNKEEFYRKLADMGDVAESVRRGFRQIENKERLALIPKGFLDDHLFSKHAFTQIIELDERRSREGTGA